MKYYYIKSDHETNNLLYCISSAMNRVLNNPKNQDPSYKTDLDLWDCFGKLKLVL